MSRALAAAAAALLLAGCAARMPAPTPAPVPTPAVSGETPVPTPPVTRPAARRPAPAPASVDSLPSRDALEVLASIPEPIAGGSAPPPPVPVPVPTPAPAPVVVPTPSAHGPEGGSGVPALGDSVTQPETAIDHGVPVPAPTRPMGDDPDDPVTLPPLPPPAADTTRPAAPAAPAAPPPGAVAEADTVWRVQVGAPAEADKAEVTRRGAESLLLMPFVIEREGGLHKVRTRARLSRESAERLRARALDSGFTGAFLLRQPGTR